MPSRTSDGPVPAQQAQVLVLRTQKGCPRGHERHDTGARRLDWVVRLVGCSINCYDNERVLRALSLEASEATACRDAVRLRDAGLTSTRAQTQGRPRASMR